MAEAVRIRGLSVCIYHENMYKDSNARRKIRKELGLRKEYPRKMWRKTLRPPPPSDEARSTLTSMHKAVMSLAIGDWDCQILAQDMPYNLAGLLVNICGPGKEYEQATSGHLERGKLVYF